jgi:hypothetical protein
MFYDLLTQLHSFSPRYKISGFFNMLAGSRGEVNFNKVSSGDKIQASILRYFNFN